MLIYKWSAAKEVTYTLPRSQAKYIEKSQTNQLSILKCNVGMSFGPPKSTLLIDALYASKNKINNKEGIEESVQRTIYISRVIICYVTSRLAHMTKYIHV